MIFKTFLKRLFPRSFDEQIYNLTPKELIIRKSSNHGGFKFGLFLLTVIFLFAIFGPVILDVSPYEQDLTKRLLPPVWKEGGTWEYVFGTDGNGRDYFARILYGTRISLTIGFGAACVGMIIGVTLGVCAGYFGG